MQARLKRFGPFVALGCYWLLLNIVVLHLPIKVFPSPIAEPISKVLVAENDSSLNSDHSGWSAARLPHDWYHSDTQATQRWYKAEISVDPNISSRWGIYLPHVTHNVEAYVNGFWVGRGGRFEAPVSRHHNKPLLFAFSSKILHPGTNEVVLRVAAASWRQGLLDAFYVAPHESLVDAWQWKHWLRVDFIQWFTLAMYTMSALLFFFWIVRPQDKTYGWFALLLFIWATHNLNLFVSDVPVDSKYWEALMMSTLGWTVVTMIFFNHRFVGERSPRIEKLMLTFAVAGIGIFFLPSIESVLVVGYGVWDCFLIVFGSYAIYHLGRVYAKRRDTDVYLMLLVGVPILVFGFHDILTVNNLRDRREGLVIQYSVIPAAILFSWFMIRRFLESIAQAEELAETLEMRVQARETELKTQYQRLNQLEHERTLSRERERIMRDMHDGLGGQLLALRNSLAQHDSEPYLSLRQRVQHSINDLRLVIDSLDPVLNDLPTLLGMMRVRFEDQLETTGIQLHWQLEDLPDNLELKTGSSLHLMRILQELMTNVVRHSKANNVYFKVCTRPNKVVIELEDDGCGLTRQANCGYTGRGLENMRYRAGLLNAEFMIGPGSKLCEGDEGTHAGTKARLVLSFNPDD